MEIHLSHEPPPEKWGTKSLLSTHEEGLAVHLSGRDTPLRRVQKAGRQVSNLGIRSVSLVGPGWEQELQWALAQGLATPRDNPELHWGRVDQTASEWLTNCWPVAQWVRDITNTTPEDLPPEALAVQVAEFLTGLRADDVRYDITRGKALRDVGLVGIYGVGRGSDRPPALLSLDFNPGSNEHTPVAAALVGKGITFDSGGYSMKKSQAMLPMKGDMGGAAMAAGGLALAMLSGLNRRVRLLLCCAENLVSGHAYKLGDILTYRNGVSVEVVNTDAEGRLVLADGLVLAGETKAPLILDAATLTGAAHTALGNDYNAVFALDKELQRRVVSYSEAENEWHWPLPLELWHQDYCPSDYADTANSRPVPGGGPGGATNAAGFLSRFVPRNGRGWIHLDLAGAFRAEAGELWAAGATAMGIRTIARTLLEETA